MYKQQKITFSSQTKKCAHLAAFGEKKLKIKNEKKENNNFLC